MWTNRRSQFAHTKDHDHHEKCLSLQPKINVNLLQYWTVAWLYGYLGYIYKPNSTVETPFFCFGIKNDEKTNNHTVFISWITFLHCKLPIRKIKTFTFHQKHIGYTCKQVRTYQNLSSCTLNHLVFIKFTNHVNDFKNPLSFEVTFEVTR